MWPESVLRDETMAVLGITDLTSLLESTPRLDHVAALAEAAAWLGRRDTTEQAPRTGVPGERAAFPSIRHGLGPEE
jgi:hypothetical protein